jgi:hypothetical protein
MDSFDTANLVSKITSSFKFRNTIVAKCIVGTYKRIAATLLTVSAFPSSGLAQAALPPPLGGARVTGQITGLVGSNLQLSLRSGRTVTVNLRSAQAHDLVPRLYVGEFVQVQGSLTAPAALTAASVMRAKSAPAAWSADIP